MLNPKLPNQLGKLAMQASQGLETCSTCTSGACCKNNSNLEIHQAELADRRHLFLSEKYLDKTRSAIDSYNKTGLFTCPFFDEDTNRCTVYENRFYTCATFVAITPPENCSTGKDRTVVAKSQITPLIGKNHKKLAKDLLRVQKTPKVNLIEAIQTDKILKDIL